MTARLPILDQDADDWGEILNQFLAVAHNPDGTLASGSTIIQVNPNTGLTIVCSGGTSMGLVLKGGPVQSGQIFQTEDQNGLPIMWSGQRNGSAAGWYASLGTYVDNLHALGWYGDTTGGVGTHGYSYINKWSSAPFDIGAAANFHGNALTVSPLQPPAMQATAIAGTSTLAAGTYYYVATAINNAGTETVAGPVSPVTTTSLLPSVQLVVLQNWGMQYANIYRSTSPTGPFQFVESLNPQNPSKFGSFIGLGLVDNGINTTVVVPPTSNPPTGAINIIATPGLGYWSSVQAQPSAYRFPYLHRALANIQSAATGDKTAGLIGDSTTWGLGGVGGIGSTLTIAQLLTAAGINSALGMSLPDAPNDSFSDARWSAGTGWTQNANLGAFSFSALNAVYIGASGAAANTLTFTPSSGYSYDTFDVWYLQTSGGGHFDAAIDSGSATTTNTNGTPAIMKVTISGSPGTSHVLKIGNVTTAQVFIIGIEPSLSTTPTLRIGNLGVAGGTSTGWASSAQGASGSIAAIEAYAADFWIVNLGINDGGAGTNLANYLANLLTIVTACKLSGDVFVCSPFPSNPTLTNGGHNYVAFEAEYAVSLPAFCAANQCQFVDFFNMWGGPNGWNELDALGFYFNNDHPSTHVGYPDAGRTLARSILGA